MESLSMETKATTDGNCQAIWTWMSLILVGDYESPKEKLGLKTLGMYSILRQCGKVYWYQGKRTPPAHSFWTTRQVGSKCGFSHKHTVRLQTPKSSPPNPLHDQNIKAATEVKLHPNKQRGWPILRRSRKPLVHSPGQQQMPLNLHSIVHIVSPYKYSSHYTKTSPSAFHRHHHRLATQLAP
jgi:hypothetical protein